MISMTESHLLFFFFKYEGHKHTVFIFSLAVDAEIFILLCNFTLRNIILNLFQSLCFLQIGEPPPIFASEKLK